MENRIMWDRRIHQWLNKLRGDLYRPTAPIEWEGFITTEQLGYDRAMREGRFSPMPQGKKWGRDWEYLWIRSTITLPEEVRGKQINLNLDTGGESSVYVNGKEFGGRRAEWVNDETHRMSDLVLTENAVPGTQYEIVLETYAGHSFPDVCRGPMFEEESAVRAVPSGELRTVIGQSSFGVWNEAAFQLYIDMKSLLSLREALPKGSLMTDDVEHALQQITVVVDFDQPPEERTRSYQKARELTAPIYACKNGTLAPQFFAFGHAHIDIAWLWPIAETERKVHRTFAAQLAHMERYPEYKFLQSQPHLYRMTKQLYPALYERICEKVRTGQWIPEGGMWVEADANVPSGESLIRQFVHGKRFFKEEFGVDSKMLWLPDVFGYNGAMPQIMKGCGVDYFSTHKIWWGYNGGDPFPYNDFFWKGIDGTAVRTFLHTDYTSDTLPATMYNRWEHRRQQYDLRGFIIPFGYGDGGGGPSREHIEHVIRQKDLQNLPRMSFSHVNDYFDYAPLPKDTYEGELYFQCHRGVQTSQAKVKLGNRRCEQALRETEALGVLAKQHGYAYPLDQMDEHWKQVLLCQFHDIVPGSSIARVYDEAWQTHQGVLHALADIRCDMARSLCDGQDAVTVFNSLSFDRVVLAPLPDGWEGAAHNGDPLPVQEQDGKLIARVTVPAMGSAVLTPAAPVCGRGCVTARITADGAVLQNDRITVTFNRRGEIVSAITPIGEMMHGLGNELKMYRDVPTMYEAWDIDDNYELMPVELPEDADIEVVSAGALAATLRITRRIHKSEYTQLVTLRAHSDRVDFDTVMDWQESQKLLKVAFDVNVQTTEAIHEIQFGQIARPNHRSRPFDFDRYEVPQHRYTALCEGNRGVAVLNDCKYGVSTFETTINLSLLRSPRAPDDQADIGEQHFTYSFLPFAGALCDSDLVREAYDLNCPAAVYDGAWEQGSAVTVSAKNVFVDTVKPAEDGSDDVILRLYEAMGVHTETELAVCLPHSGMEACNMLEESGESLAEQGGRATLSFHPFEVKTIRVKA